MQVLLLLVIELASLCSVHLFRIPGIWALGRQFSTKSASVGSYLPSVHIGNLPSNFDEGQLHELLKIHSISGYESLSLLPYETADNEKYGKIRFSEKSLAESAVKSLNNATVADSAINAAVMTRMTRLFAQSFISNISRADLTSRVNEILGENEIVNCATYLFENRTNSIYLDCKSPPRALRAASKLSSFKYKDQSLKFVVVPDFKIRPHGIFIGNLHPNIKTTDFQRIMHEILGPKQVEHFKIPLDPRTGRSKCLAFVYFNTQEQAERAVGILNGYKLMDRTLKADIDTRDNEVSRETAMATFTSHAMYLGNVDTMESMENVEKFCNDAVQAAATGDASLDGGKVTRVMFHRAYRTGYLLPSCMVFFSTAQARDRCVEALNGTKWNDRELYVSSSKDDGENFSLETRVFMANFPSSLSQEEAVRTVESLLGEKIIRGLHLGQENGKAQATRARLRLQGSVIKGIRQDIRPCLSQEQLSNFITLKKKFVTY